MVCRARLIAAAAALGWTMGVPASTLNAAPLPVESNPGRRSMPATMLPWSSLGRLLRLRRWMTLGPRAWWPTHLRRRCQKRSPGIGRAPTRLLPRPPVLLRLCSGW
eukprot:10295152-Alexandrium_andersonii.AAC.1